MLKTLSTLIDLAKSKSTRRLAVAAAADKPVLEAVRNAKAEGIVDPILVGNEEAIRKVAAEVNFDLTDVKVVDIQDGPVAASVKAVELVRTGEADVLMKGHVSTGPLLKAVLDKEKGLRKGGTLSHVAFFESPYYHKLICLTDAAMNVAPDFDGKIAIVKNAVEAYNKLGVATPKVAVVGAVEVVNPKMEATVHAAMLTQMNRRGQIKNCLIDGPLAIDNAVSKEAAEHKGIVSDVAGDADIIVTPNIESGNIMYKTLGFMGGASTAAVIMGARVPIVLTSRSDNDKAKMLSIALAAAME